MLTRRRPYRKLGVRGTAATAGSHKTQLHVPSLNTKVTAHIILL
jgi:hypothetical protein